MSREVPYPFNIRDKLGEELWAEMQSYPEKGSWKEGITPIGLMRNSAGHPDGEQALNLVVENVIKAHGKETPIDLVRLALNQAIEWRDILLETQPKDDEVVGAITLKDLEIELRGKLPDDYLKQLFSD